jgi:hypothetical protein
MPRNSDTGRPLIDALIRELRDIRGLSARDRIGALAPFVDRASGQHIEGRLVAIRAAAARDAVRDADGNQTTLARDLGLSPQRISALVNGSAAKRKRKSDVAAEAGAVGG